MAGNRPGMPAQQMAATNQSIAAAQALLTANGINPNTLNPQQFQQFVNQPPAAQQKSIAVYSQNLQQHHGAQMGNKQMPNAGVPQGQGSPMMPPGPDGTALNAFYNPGDMAGPGGIRPGPGGAQAAAGSNHALQDYQMQLMLLEQQNKKRLMMARQEQDTITGMPRDGAAPGAPGQPGQGPNGQSFPDASPQAMRTGASPNPADQMKRGTPQMNNSGIPSPVPEGGQSRDSPNPAMNFMGNQVDPNMAPHFFKPGVDGNMAAAQAQMNGMRPPSSHPGQPFNGQMNPQQMMAARQMQQQGQPQGQQWQQGPNGQMPQMMQQNQQAQGTPQQRSMPPPSAPAAGGANNNNRTTASPQQAAAAPPTPSQSNKAAPKKKETKAAKEKRAAAAKKASQNAAANNASATPAADSAEAEATPATPVTPAFNKGQNGATTTAASAPAATAAAPAPQVAPVPPQGHDSQNGMGMDNFGGMVSFSSPRHVNLPANDSMQMEFGTMELANPLQSGDVLNDFDFDSFLHDGDGSNEPFNFNDTFAGMEGGEIGAD